MSKLIDIKLLVVDVDGVMTDGTLTYGKNNQNLRSFNVRDGIGINLLHANKIHVAIISGGNDSGIKERAQDLKIKYVYTKVRNKLKKLMSLQKRLNISVLETAYIGDDINDLVVKPSVGILMCPKDAHESFKKKADIILNNNGGQGVVREISDKILRDKKICIKSQIDSIVI